MQKRYSVCGKEWVLGVFFIIFGVGLWNPLIANTGKQDSLFKVLQTAKQDSHRVKALCLLCHDLAHINPDTALLLGEQGLRLANQLKSPKEIAFCLQKLGKLNTETTNFTQATTYLNRSLKIYLSLKDSAMIGLTLKYIAEVNYYQGHYSDAILHFEEALKVFTALNDARQIAVSLSNLAMAYHDKGDYPKALKLHLDGLRICEKIGNHKLAAKINADIGYIYIAQKLYDKAIQAFKKNLAIHEQSRDKGEIAEMLSAIGTVYAEQKKFDTALPYFQKAKPYYLAIHDKMGDAQTSMNIANIYMRTQKYEQALKEYLHAKQLFEETEAHDALAVLYTNVTESYMRLKQPAQAAEMNKKAIALAQETGSLSNLSDAYLNRASIDSAYQDYKAAFEDYKKGIHYRDSFLSMEVSNHLHELNVQFETEQKEHKIHSLEHQREKDLKQAELERKIQYGLSAFSVVLTMFLGLSYYSYQSKKRSNIKLQAQNLEIQHQKEEILSQNEQITQQMKRLQELDDYKQAMGAMIIHDLKNPLSSIISLAEHAEQPRNQKMIKQAGQQMLNLVSNILDIHKADNTCIMLQKQDVLLLECVQQAISQVDMLLENKKQNLSCTIPPYICVKVDTELMIRVIVNLLTNAIKYTPNNGAITLFAEQYEGNDDFIKFSVADTGQGIPADKAALVFERFGQVEAKNSGLARSTGLGLTFCKMAIEAHGGIIDLMSEVGKGTTFFFTIPKGKTFVPNLAHTFGEAYQFQIHHQADPTTTLQLSQEEKQYLRPFVEKMKVYDVFEVTDVRSVFQQIEPFSHGVKNWKEQLENAVHFCNEDEYNKLLSLYLS